MDNIQSYEMKRVYWSLPLSLPLQFLGWAYEVEEHLPSRSENIMSMNP